MTTLKDLGDITVSLDTNDEMHVKLPGKLKKLEVLVTGDGTIFIEGQDKDGRWIDAEIDIASEFKKAKKADKKGREENASPFNFTPFT